jgi:hypothetical protein
MSPLYNEQIPNPSYLVPPKLPTIQNAKAIDPLTPIEQYPPNTAPYSSYPQPPLNYQYFRQLDKNVQINKHNYLVDGGYYKLFPNGYITPGWKNILKPIDLTYPRYIPPLYGPQFPWGLGNNPLSYGIESSFYQTDFKTFGPYIHHSLAPSLPLNLHSFSEIALSNYFKNIPFIKNGSINVFPKLVKNQSTFNSYNRIGRYIP